MDGADDALDYAEDYTNEPDVESALVENKQADPHAHTGAGTDEEDAGADGPTSGVESTGLNAIHSSYLQHIRTLQKTNSALQKKIDYLSALQNDHTKIKLVKKLQRILREKQIMVDDLAELVMGGGLMSVDALSAHLQNLIEHNALDQPNPARLKKELMESKKTEAATRLELNKLRKQMKALDGAAKDITPAAAAASGASSARTLAVRNEANAQMEAERAAHAALRSEFLSLSASHTTLQSSHHTLTLSLGEHKKLIADVTGENRTLRGYLTQWEASEERRILAEQNVLLLQETAQRTYQEREGIFQEMRQFKQKLLALARAKTKAAEEAAAAIQLARKNEQTAREHASVLSRQLELLKSDLKSSGEIVEWHRSQNVIHLSKAAKSDVASLEKTHKEELNKLNKKYDALVNKHSLLLEKEGEETPALRVSQYALLKENESLRNAIALLEIEVGNLGTKADAAEKGCADAKAASKQSSTELEVLQRALQQMAIDLQEVQRTLRDKDAALQHAVDVKIPKMRLQRHNLAIACQRQNTTIQELTRQIEAANGKKPSTTTGEKENRSNSSKRREGHSSSSSHNSASATDISRRDDSSSSPVRPSASSSSGTGTAPRRPQSAHVSSSTSSSSSAAPAASNVSVAAAASAPSSSPSSKVTSPVKASEVVHAVAAIAAADDAEDTYEDDDDPFAVAPVPAESTATAASNNAAAGSSPVAPAAQSSSSATDAVAWPSAADEWFDPSGVWVRCATDDGAAFYFFNNSTGQSVWYDPLLPAPSEDGTAVAATAAATSSSNAATAAAPSSDLDLTPFGTQRSNDLPQLSTRANSTTGSKQTAVTPAAAASAPSDPFADDEFPVEEAIAEEAF